MKNFSRVSRVSLCVGFITVLNACGNRRAEFRQALSPVLADLNDARATLDGIKLASTTELQAQTSACQTASDPAAYFECQPRFLWERLSNVRGQIAYALDHLAALNRSGGARTEYSNETRGESALQVLEKNAAGLPRFFVDRTFDSLILRYELDAASEYYFSSVDRPDRIELRLSRADSSWWIEMSTQQSNCDPTKPWASVTTRVLGEIRSGIWIGKSMSYHPTLGAQLINHTAASTCDFRAGTASQSLLIYADFIANSEKLSGSFYATKTNLTSDTAIPNFSMNEFCLTYLGTSNCGAELGRVATFANPFCAAGNDLQWNTACSAADVFDPSQYLPTQDWLSPDRYVTDAELQIVLPTSLR